MYVPLTNTPGPCGSVAGGLPGKRGQPEEGTWTRTRSMYHTAKGGGSAGAWRARLV